MELYIYMFVCVCLSAVRACIKIIDEIQYPCSTPLFVQLSVVNCGATLVFSNMFGIALIRYFRSRIFQRNTLLTLSDTFSRSIKIKCVSFLYSLLLFFSSFKLKMASMHNPPLRNTVVPLMKHFQPSLSDGYFYTCI